MKHTVAYTVSRRANGYPHIGHATHLLELCIVVTTRTMHWPDDTNPEKEDVEYVEQLRMMCWLGFNGLVIFVTQQITSIRFTLMLWN